MSTRVKMRLTAGKAEVRHQAGLTSPKLWLGVCVAWLSWLPCRPLGCHCHITKAWGKGADLSLDNTCPVTDEAPLRRRADSRLIRFLGDHRGPLGLEVDRAPPNKRTFPGSQAFI